MCASEVFQWEGLLPSRSASKSPPSFQMGIQIPVSTARCEKNSVQLCLLSVRDLSSLNPELGWIVLWKLYASLWLCLVCVIATSSTLLCFVQEWPPPHAGQSILNLRSSSPWSSVFLLRWNRDIPDFLWFLGFFFNSSQGISFEEHLS